MNRLHLFKQYVTPELLTLINYSFLIFGTLFGFFNIKVCGEYAEICYGSAIEEFTDKISIA